MKKHLRAPALTITSLVILLLLWGCGVLGSDVGSSKPRPLVQPAASPSASASPQTTTALLPVTLPQLTGAQSIRIEDDWTGKSYLAPLLAHYDLARSGDEFRGQGFFSIASYSSKLFFQETQEITIPISIMHDFLSKLQQVHPEEGNYPPAPCCDDYPTVHIKVQLPAERVVFFTNSPLGGLVSKPPPKSRDLWVGRQANIPWGLSLKDKIYLINSPAPAEALATIDPYLRKDVWDKLLAEYNSR
jgi:hypothetical protein